MENVTFIEIETLSGIQKHAIIDREDGSQVAMLKSTYEAQQAEQSTPIVVPPTFN
jgi:hypothetical protein